MMKNKINIYYYYFRCATKHEQDDRDDASKAMAIQCSMILKSVTFSTDTPFFATFQTSPTFFFIERASFLDSSSDEILP